MADILEVATYEQIQQILSRLATNYSNIASAFFEIFYDPTPKDVTFQIFNDAGVLTTYTIPNRAKDFRNMLNGKGSPEGKIIGNLGMTYQDTENGNIYIKENGTGTQGWSELVSEDYLKTILIRGSGNPEGNVSGNKGILYIDVTNSALYMKTSVTGNTGWVLIALGVPTAKFANRDLSNLSSRGEARFDAKEDKSNKVTQISSDSTDIEYPSAKCVFDNVKDKITFEEYGRIIIDI